MFKLLVNVLIKLKIKCHSGKFIPVAFCSGEFRGTFRYQFQNTRIPPEWKITEMALLAEPPANFHSSGMHQILLESPESCRNLWGTDKTSYDSMPSFAQCLPFLDRHYEIWQLCIFRGCSPCWRNPRDRSMRLTGASHKFLRGESQPL